ncbi:MAG: HipA domain-containing protein [Acidimicrobiales bacterium]
MASRPGLDVWLYGTLIGELSEPQFAKMRLDFTEEAERTFRPGAIILSTSLPTNAQRRPNGNLVRAFFGGLLPEGESRGVIAREFDVDSGDNFGLLAAIGRDCAGAVVLLPHGSTQPSVRGDVKPLSGRDLATLVANLRERPLGANNEIRVSLPGAQEKLLLVRRSDGRWGQPVNGAPSTHILKPQDMRLPSYAVAESFCLRLAKRLALTTVDSEVIDVDGRPVIVVARYDRTSGPEGTVRTHQEDICQALGVDTSNDPYLKYESGGGPSLSQVAELLAQFAPSPDRAKLLALTVLNVAVGNADCHAKNISLLHMRDGTVTLAPAYDITPTTFYKNVPTAQGPKDLSDQLGMRINAKKSIHDVTMNDLIAEGVRWGLPKADADHVVLQTLAEVARHSTSVGAEVDLPSELLEFVVTRTARLANGVPAAE